MSKIEEVFFPGASRPNGDFRQGPCRSDVDAIRDKWSVAEADRID